MKFIETPLKGAFVVEPERLKDDRGFFARTFCQREFEKRGLNSNFVQCNISFNKRKGSIRGMHFQATPYEESKLIRCTSGAICDVILDLRQGSETFKQWFSIELTAESRSMLYVPHGFAHGFQTLENNSEVLYQMSEFYYPQSARGVRWNDPQVGIKWLLDVTEISDRDKEFSLLVPEFEGV